MNKPSACPSQQIKDRDKDDNTEVEQHQQQQLEMVAKAFVDHYYNLFDTNRTALACLYHHTSMLSFKGQKSMGTKEIGRKLAQLLFEQCKHSISTVDCQLSVFICGSPVRSTSSSSARCFS